MKKQRIEPETLPLYQQVKDHIIGKINGGLMQAGMRIESEAELVASLNVSKMTVNRALRELAAEGKVKRIQGKGTFVAERKPRSALLESKSIATEIQERGGSYSCTAHLLQEEKAKPSIAASMGLAPYSDVFHSIIVHKDKRLGLIGKLPLKAVSTTPVPVILWVEILSRHQSGALGLHDLHCQE